MVNHVATVINSWIDNCKTFSTMPGGEQEHSAGPVVMYFENESRLMCPTIGITRETFKLLKGQALPRPIKAESLGVGPRHLRVFKTSSGDSSVLPQWRIAALPFFLLWPPSFPEECMLSDEKSPHYSRHESTLTSPMERNNGKNPCKESPAIHFPWAP